jgi:tetratricopeptide (TPR) repeat protein
LYKLDRKREALEDEKKAISLALPGLKSRLIVTLFKMMKDEPTWIEPSVGNDTSKPINIKADVSRWKKVRDIVAENYPSGKTDSLISLSKIKYYKRREDWKLSYTKSLVSIMKAEETTSPIVLNEYAWEVFSYAADRAELETALKWSERAVKAPTDRYHAFYLDTYANLLYKLGRASDAITIQQKAINLSAPADKQNFLTTLNKMKNGEKTWKE